MSRPPASPTHERYHAHVYFGPASVEQARQLTEQAAQRFSARLGRLHKKPVGPHPRWSRQLAFESTVYEELLAWLDAHRDGLTVLVHADTGDDIADHTDHAWWLGQPETLDLDALKD